MDILNNLDLLSVGVTMAAIAILGFVVIFNNPKSITNKSFFFLSITANIYGILNYLSYQPQSDFFVLWTLRLVIFSAVWYAYSLFQLLYVFPKDVKFFPRWYKYILLPIVTIISFINLTPFVFNQLSTQAVANEVAKVVIGPGLPLFIAISVFLIFGSLVILITKTKKATGVLKSQLKLILIGSFITYSLIIVFSLILPTVFSNVTFVKLAPVFALPFIIFTFYSMYRHKLFNIKDMATIILTFALSVTTFLEIIYSTGFSQILFRSSIFLLVLIFSTQLIRNMIKLEQANVRLQELDVLKSEFVSLATHQIRAPLSAIKGYLSEVFEGDFGPVTDELKKPLQIVFQSTENLVHIVGDFLNISRIEQNKMKYELKPLNLKQLVEELKKELKPNIDRAGLGFSFEAPAGNYEIYADIGKVREVVSNLVDNALKYTKQGSIKITLSSNEATQKVRLAVTDTGIGIDPAVMPKLFQKFTRAEGANEVNIIGTGLGLYVAKMMIEGQGGRIWAESAGLGKGSQFYVELPIAHIS